MFGTSKTPKEIPEAARYDSVELGLSIEKDEREMVLKRSLRGGDFRLILSGQADRVLGAKHQSGDEETVSSLLLGLSGLVGKTVLTNKQGKTRSLSFRDLAPLILVDEETIISETSPILSGQYTSRTVETAVFRLLLSGVDDSTVIAIDDPKEAKGRLQGKTEVLEVLLARTQGTIAELNLDGESFSLQKQLSTVENLFETASAELSVEQETVAQIEDKRRKIWETIRQAQSRIDVLSELQGRFDLLEQQYSSDLRRLQSIAQAGARLGQLKQERCPVCGAMAEHQVHEHQTSDPTTIEVANACRAEASKIRILVADLERTRNDNASEIVRLAENLQTNQTAFESVSIELRKRVEPRLQVTLQRLRDTQAQRDILVHALGLQRQAEELEGLLLEISKVKKRGKVEGPSTEIASEQAERFSEEVQALLEAWHFPNLGRVTFSEVDKDVVISGRLRASHGKGVRAIAHAAFNLALLRCCRNQTMPHPGLVIIDSPLVVYEEPDVGEDGFPPDLMDAFYRSVATSFTNEQVIVLENEKAAPPADLSTTVEMIRFTGSSKGRKGFIPSRP